jgi:hypothetical protein
LTGAEALIAKKALSGVIASRGLFGKLLDRADEADALSFIVAKAALDAARRAGASEIDASEFAGAFAEAFSRTKPEPPPIQRKGFIRRLISKDGGASKDDLISYWPDSFRQQIESAFRDPSLKQWSRILEAEPTSLDGFLKLVREAIVLDSTAATAALVHAYVLSESRHEEQRRDHVLTFIPPAAALTAAGVTLATEGLHSFTSAVLVGAGTAVVSSAPAAYEKYRKRVARRPIARLSLDKLYEAVFEIAVALGASRDARDEAGAAVDSIYRSFTIRLRDAALRQDAGRALPFHLGESVTQGAFDEAFAQIGVIDNLMLATTDLPKAITDQYLATRQDFVDWCVNVEDALFCLQALSSLAVLVKLIEGFRDALSTRVVGEEAA